MKITKLSLSFLFCLFFVWSATSADLSSQLSADNAISNQLVEEVGGSNPDWAFDANSSFENDEAVAECCDWVEVEIKLLIVKITRRKCTRECGAEEEQIQ